MARPKCVIVASLGGDAEMLLSRIFLLWGRRGRRRSPASGASRAVVKVAMEGAVLRILPGADERYGPRAAKSCREPPRPENLSASPGGASPCMIEEKRQLLPRERHPAIDDRRPAGRVIDQM